MKQERYELLSKYFSLRPVDTSEYDDVKVSGMKYEIEAYDAEDFGRVTCMHAAGFLGLMKMDTLMLNPFSVDAPLCSVENIHFGGKNMLFAELYDTTLAHRFDSAKLKELVASYDGLESIPQKSHWYDDLHLDGTAFLQGKKAPLEELSDKYIALFLELARASEHCDSDEKRASARVYTEGLLSHGGPATDPFMKSVGREKTSRLFREVLFGTR